jgi:hypothetical protein
MEALQLHINKKMETNPYQKSLLDFAIFVERKGNDYTNTIYME